MYLPGGNTQTGVSVPAGTALNFGLSDSFTVLAVVALWANPGGNVMVFSQQHCNPGAVQMQVTAQGFLAFRIEGTNSVSYVFAAPPILADGLPHLVVIQRDRGATQLRAYADGKLIVQVADPTTTAITNGTTDNRIGHRYPCTGADCLPGAVQHIAVWKSAISAADIAALWSELYGGNPPVGSLSPNQTIINSIQAAYVADQAKLDQIYAAVHRTYP